MVLGPEPRRAADQAHRASYHHAGQVSFPGGRIDPGRRHRRGRGAARGGGGDRARPGRRGAAGAAGVLRHHTGFGITPILGLLPGRILAELRPRPAEVERDVRAAALGGAGPRGAAARAHGTRGRVARVLGLAASAALHLGRDRRRSWCSSPSGCAGSGGMLRAFELGLFLVPTALFVAWLVLGRVATRRFVVAALLAVAALGTLAVIYGLDALDPRRRHLRAGAARGRADRPGPWRARATRRRPRDEARVSGRNGAGARCWPPCPTRAWWAARCATICWDWRWPRSISRRRSRRRRWRACWRRRA